MNTKSINLHGGVPKEKREKEDRENIRSDGLRLSKFGKTHEYKHLGSSTRTK